MNLSVFRQILDMMRIYAFRQSIIIPFICSFILFLLLFILLKLSWYSSVLVGLFCFVTIVLTLKAIELKKQLIRDISLIENNIRGRLVDEIRSFCNEELKHNFINKFLFIENLYNKNYLSKNWEKDKRYYQSLPNILISIGLSGTFLGITTNLFSISSRLSDKFTLEEVLPQIIGSMAIAFISSLIALACSIILTTIYPNHELDIAKEQLFISLESELEKTIIQNQPSVNLDQKIGDLVNSINIYSQSLSQFIRTIPQINQEFQATVISTASSFQKIAEQSAQIIRNDTQIFTNTSVVLQDAASGLTQLTTNLSGLINVASGIIDTIQKTQVSLDSTSSSLSEYTNQNGQSVIALSNISNRIQDLINSNQQNLNRMTTQLQDNMNSLINSNKQNINTIATQLQDNINNLSVTTQSFTQNTSQLTNTLHQDIGTFSNTTQSFSNNMSQVAATFNMYNTQIDNQNNNLQQAVSLIARYIQEMRTIQQRLTYLIQLIEPPQNP